MYIVFKLVNKLKGNKYHTCRHNSILSLSTIFLLYFRNVPTMSYFHVSFILKIQSNDSRNCHYCHFKQWSAESMYMYIVTEGVPRENHWSAASRWQTLSYNVVSRTPRYEWDSNWQCWWW